MDQQKIGRHLAEMRKAKQLTQAQLAETLGVSDRSVSRWENGATMPDISLFRPLCAALDMTLDEFLSGESSAPQSQTQVSVQHMEGYARYLTARSRRRTSAMPASAEDEAPAQAASESAALDQGFAGKHTERKLLRRHFKGEASHRLFRGARHLHRDVHGEGGLTHTGTGANQH